MAATVGCSPAQPALAQARPFQTPFTHKASTLSAAISLLHPASMQHAKHVPSERALPSNVGTGHAMLYLLSGEHLMQDRTQQKELGCRLNSKGMQGFFLWSSSSQVLSVFLSEAL
jgi:hypothetical protein